MKKADFIVMGVVLAVALIVVACLHLFGTGGNMVELEVDGKIVEVLSLDTDTTREIETDYGKNTLVIENGCATMTFADCPDGICTNHKPISKTGESIICLPHKVVVSVINDKSDNNDIDAVA